MTVPPGLLQSPHVRAHVGLSRVGLECRGLLAFLATPVGGPGVRDAAARWVAALAAEGVAAVSPAVLTGAAMDAAGAGDGLPFDSDFWDGLWRPVLWRAGAVIVPPMAAPAGCGAVSRVVRSAVGAGLPVWILAEGESV